MPKEVADALKQAGYWNEQQGERGTNRHDRRARPLRAGAGARAWPWCRAPCRLVGAARRDPTLTGVAEPAACAQFLFVTVAFAALMHGYVTSDFSIDNVAANSHSTKPLIYKISGTWGNHEGSLVLWVWILALFGAAVAAARAQPAALVPRPRAGRAGADRRGLPGLHAVHLEPVPAARPGAARRARPQPDPAGPRPRLPSADALPRLCRPLDRLLVRRRRPDRGPGRRHLGALGAALDAGRLGRADARHRARQLVGLLRARLGRLVVLGPGRERLVHALARRHGAAALGDRGREARHAEELDHPAGDPGLLALAARAPSWSARAC